MILTVELCTVNGAWLPSCFLGGETVQHKLTCKACQRPFGTVEAATNLEIPCPWCYETTLYETHGDRLTTTLLRGKSPEQLTGARKHDAFAKMMRDNRGIDADKC